MLIRHPITSLALALILTLGAAVFGTGAMCQEPAQDLSRLSLEDLMNIEVTSPAKKEQKLFDSSSAIYVITQEDIRRSGVTSIPEALRMVPGLEVAQIDANKWAISSRGFNGRFANNMLVLIDGRSVYSPLFGGVYWDVQDTFLADIDRIEVIRGPGGSLWGANAVNGIINIITKPTSETKGIVLSAGGGTEEQNYGGARYGRAISPTAAYKVYAKGFRHDSYNTPSDGSADDDWSTVRGGFRIDAGAVHADSFTLQGDIYDGDTGQTVTLPLLVAPYSRTVSSRTDIFGANVLGRWNRTLARSGSMTLQLFYDTTKRGDALVGEERHTYDLDFQHQLNPGKRNEVIWGLGFRVTTDSIDNTDTTRFDPLHRHDAVYSAFVQDDIVFAGTRGRLTFGSKIEHNDYTGFELQPNIRLLWKLEDKQNLWFAASRAVRTPSRAFSDVRADYSAGPTVIGLTNLVTIVGNHDLKSEGVYAFEVGYRISPNDRLSVDIATFHNLYESVLSAEPGQTVLTNTPPPLHLVTSVVFSDEMHGVSDGVELACNWKATERWRLSGGFTWLRIRLRRDPTSHDLASADGAGNNPTHQLQLRSLLDLPKHFEFDTTAYLVDDLPRTQVPGYVRLDMRLGWNPRPSFGASLGFQNMLDNRHLEFHSAEVVNATEIQRGVYAMVTWRH